MGKIILGVGVIVVTLSAIIYFAKHDSFAPLAPEWRVEEPAYDEDDTSVGIAIGDELTLSGVSIVVREVVEDSRCPVDVTCIQAGTVRVRADLESGLGAASQVFTLGETITTEAEAITLIEVFPEARSTRELEDEEYRFVFEIQKRTESKSPKPISGGKCYVGGCSSEVCSDQPDVASACMYRQEYACYRNAICERQQSGECGWTETAALRQCLSDTSVNDE